MRANLTKLDKFAFWFIIIDNLFFPYFWVKCVSYSFPIIFLWRFQRTQMLLPYNKTVIIIAVLSGFSTLLGSVLYQEYAFDDLVIYLNVLSALFSLQLFVYVRNNSQEDTVRKIHRVLFLFICAAFAFAMVYFIDFSQYESMRKFFNTRIGESGIDILSKTIRYGYYWSDENNIGYMTCAVLLFISMDKYIKTLWKYLAVLMVIIIVIATMSSGALVSLVIALICFALFQILRNPDSSRLSRLTILAVIAIVCAFYIDILISSDVYQAFIMRVDGKQDGNDSRIDIYRTFLTSIDWWKYMFWGYGGRTIINGVYRSSHNGVLFLTLSFGMVVMWKYCMLYFNKARGQQIKYWLWRIPVIIGFMINIMITEDKIHVLMMLMLAFECSQNYQERNLPNR